MTRLSDFWFLTSEMPQHFPSPPWLALDTSAKQKSGAPAASGRPAADTPARRTCLGAGCGRLFDSDGWGNRLCRACAKHPRSGLERV